MVSWRGDMRGGKSPAYLSLLLHRENILASNVNVHMLASFSYTMYKEYAVFFFRQKDYFFLFSFHHFFRLCLPNPFLHVMYTLFSCVPSPICDFPFQSTVSANIPRKNDGVH